MIQVNFSPRMKGFYFFIMYTEDESAMNPILIGQSHLMNICLESEISVRVMSITTWPLGHRIITIRVTDFFLEAILTKHSNSFHSEVLQNHHYSNYF